MARTSLRERGKRMMYFRQTVLHQIKSASDEKEVASVVDHSIERLKHKKVNGHLIQRFIVAMDKVLCEARLENASEKTGRNMDIAIALFKKLQRP